MAEMMPDMEQWFQTDAGHLLLKQQKALTDEVLQGLFGYHLLQVSICRDTCLYDSSKVRHRFAMGPLAGGKISGVCHEHQLALENESIDVAILHHVMEYSDHPHQLLREVSRVMMPSGHLLVLSFNPYSLMGMFSLLHRVRGWGIWQNHLLGIRRLADWLTFMDFTVQSVQYGYYQPPLNGKLMHKLSSMERLFNRWQLPFGGFYMLVARKDESRLTPVKTRRLPVPRARIPRMEPSLYTEREKNGNKKRLH